LRKLKAISIRQPWAWLIVNGYKDIENRSWPTSLRGTVLVHAGATTKGFAPGVADAIEKAYGVCIPEEGDVSGIVGVVEITDCVDHHQSKWFEGPYGWVLANPRRVPYRACPGRLRFFTPAI